MASKLDPLLKSVRSLGEEKISALAGQLLANEAFVAALQAMIAKSISAKGRFDRGVEIAMTSMNVPSAADLRALRDQLADLEDEVRTLRLKIANLEGAGPSAPAKPSRTRAKPPRGHDGEPN